MKKKRERRIAMLLAALMLIINLGISPVWAAPGDVAINQTNFPDANFRNYVSTKFDKDRNDVLSRGELDAVTRIEVVRKNITTLKGVEHFANLSILYCMGNQLTALDVTKNPKLEELYCGGKLLRTLYVTNNPELKVLYCDSSQLTAIDVTKNPKLEELYCDDNQLTALGVTNNPKLKVIRCGSNQLRALDVTKNPKLERLDCESNQLTALDVTNNPELKILSCGSSQLTAIDVTKNPKLEELYCESNQLTALDVTKNPELIFLWCNGNQLTSLNLLANTEIDNFRGYDQKYNIEVSKSNLTFDLSSLPGSFVPSKASEWKGGTVSGNTLKLNDADTNEVTYKYTARSPKFLEVTLNVKYKEQFTISFDPGDGSGQMVDVTIDAGETYVLPECGFTAPAEKEFKAWEVGGAQKAVGDSITVNADTKVKALWKDKTPETYTITFDSNGGSGTMADVTINAGESYVLPECGFTAPAGKEFKDWEVDGDEMAVEGSFTVNANTTVKALWKDKAVTPEQAVLTVNVEGGNGSVTPASATVDKGKPVEVTFAPDANYEIDTVTLDGTDVKSQVVSNKLTVTMDKSKTLTVKFKEKTVAPLVAHDVNITPATNGTVTADKTKAKQGEIVTLTITPDKGYEVDEIRVMDDGASNVPVTDNKFTMPDMLVNVTVTFKEKPVAPPIGTPVKITFDKNGGTGTMADVTKKAGETYVLPACTFTPPAGKEFKAWQVDGTEMNVGDNIVLNGDINIKAVWKDIGSVPPTPPVPPTPYTPYPWIVYPGWYHEVERPKSIEEKKINSVVIDWKIQLTIGKDLLHKEINGVESNIKMDIAPYIKDGRTMLPIRYVAEGLGFDVKWIESTRTVVLLDGTTKVEIPVDTDKIIVNGTAYTGDVKPEIKKGRTMLSIANIARALGLQDGKDIIWNDKSKTVTIYRTILVK